jgi:hypothetical protein
VPDLPLIELLPFSLAGKGGDFPTHHRCSVYDTGSQPAEALILEGHQLSGFHGP